MPPMCLQASLGPPPPRDDRDTPGLLAAHPGSTTGSTALGPYAYSAAGHANGNKRVTPGAQLLAGVLLGESIGLPADWR